MNIEKNIPIPVKKGKFGYTETLRIMEIGDSLVIPKEQQGGWRSSARSTRVKVVLRKISDTEFRLWKTA